MSKRKKTCSTEGCREKTWIEVGHVSKATLTAYCWNHYKEHTGQEKIMPGPSRDLHL